jgi:O-antigen ligase
LRATLSGDSVRRGVTLVALALTAWLIVFGHRGVGLSAGLVAIAALLDRRTWKGAGRLFSPSALRADPLTQSVAAFSFLCLWAALSAFWSPEDDAAKNALNLFITGFAGCLMAARFGRGEAFSDGLVARIFVLSVTAAIAALIFEGLTGGQLRRLLPPADDSPFRFKDMTSLARGVSATVPLAFPAAAILWADHRKLAAVALLVGATAMTPLYSVTANVIGVAAGLAAGGLAFAFPRRAPIALGAAAAALALVSAPVARQIPADDIRAGALAEVPASWRQRLVAMQAAADHGLSECPLAGCGAGYARTIADAGEEMLLAGHPVPLAVMPTHPHNMFVETQLELGLVGALSLSAFVVFGALAIAARQAPRLAVAAIAGVFGSQIASALVETSLWRTWRFATIALAAMGCALVWRKLVARGAP